MFKKLLVALIATTAVTSSAMAARYYARPQHAPRPHQAYGLYVGMTAGQAFHFDTSSTELDDANYTVTAESKTGVGVQVGYLFSQFGGIEFGAENLGTPNLQSVDSFDTTTTNTENVVASHISVIGQFPINPANSRAMVIGKLGIAGVTLGDDVLGEDATAVRMELGFGFEVNPHVMLTASYAHYFMLDTYYNGLLDAKHLAAPMGFASVGLRYQF